MSEIRGYRLKFIAEVKRITNEDIYSDGLKRFEMLGIYDKTLDKFEVVDNISDEDYDYILEEQENKENLNCVCGHAIINISFWKYENEIYLIGSDCVRKHPHFDNTTMELFNKIDKKIKKQKQDNITLKKHNEKKYIKLLESLELDLKNYTAEKKRKLNYEDTKINDNILHQGKYKNKIFYKVPVQYLIWGCRNTFFDRKINLKNNVLSYLMKYKKLDNK